MKTLFFNIKELLQVRDQSVVKVAGAAMKELPCIKNAFLRINNERIEDFGPMSELKDFNADQVIDARGHSILPAWCDSHTHIVYAASRENEFIDKIKGISYAEIARKGGGILNSAKKLQEKTEDELFNDAYNRLQDVIKMGTGSIEINIYIEERSGNTIVAKCRRKCLNSYFLRHFHHNIFFGTWNTKHVLWHLLYHFP